MSGLKQNRIVSFDVLRALAALAVVMTHVSSTVLDVDRIYSFGSVLGITFESITRFAVPVFIMISGALFLNEDRNDTVKNSVKRAVNMFVLLFLWSSFYAVGFKALLLILNGSGFVLRDFIKSLVLGHYQLWYLYVAIGLYLITPILRLFVKKDNRKIIEYFLVIALIFKFATPIINILVGALPFCDEDLYSNFIAMFNFGILNEYTVYYILGWYIYNFEIKKNYRIFIYASGLLSVIVTALATVFVSDKGVLNQMFYSNGYITIMLYSVAVFVFVFYRFKNKEITVFTKIMSKVARISFGIYAVHPFFITALVGIIPQSLNPFIQLFVNYIAVLLVSAVASFVMSKIPLVKKLIRC